MTSIPFQTTVDLTILHCTDLPHVDHPIGRNLRTSRRNVEREHKEAVMMLQNALSYAESAPSEIFDQTSRHVTICMEREQAARQALENSASSIRFSRSRLPNPFVVVTVEEDHEGDRPFVFSKTIRETSRPLWRESFRSVPLGTYMQHVINRERNEYGDRNYRPSRLVFSIYDDDAVPVQGVPRESDTVWKRYTPHRGTLLGTAHLSIDSLRSRLNMPEFEIELPIRSNSRRTSTRNNQSLTVKMKLSARIPHHDFGCHRRNFHQMNYY